MLMLPAKFASLFSDMLDILEVEWHAYEHINIKYSHTSMWFHLKGALIFKNLVYRFLNFFHQILIPETLIKLIYKSQ